MSVHGPFFTNNWSVGLNNIASIFNRKEHRAFSKLKEIYGSEMIKAEGGKTLKSVPLSKEQKRKIKEKIAKDYRNRFIKSMIILFVSIIISILILVLIVYSSKLYFDS